MDLEEKRRILFARAAALITAMYALLFARLRMLQSQWPQISYGPISIRDEERQRNLNLIYNYNDIECVNMLRMGRAPFFLWFFTWSETLGNSNDVFFCDTTLDLRLWACAMMINFLWYYIYTEALGMCNDDNFSVILHLCWGFGHVSREPGLPLCNGGGLSLCSGGIFCAYLTTAGGCVVGWPSLLCSWSDPA